MLNQKILKKSSNGLKIQVTFENINKISNTNNTMIKLTTGRLLSTNWLNHVLHLGTLGLRSINFHRPITCIE
jgi:predicted metal-dependent phosphoesterase TrpH